MTSIFSRPRPGAARQLLIFGFNGGVQFAADSLLYALLVTQLGWPLLGNLLSRGLAACLGFWLNSTWTFGAGRGRMAAQAGRYAGLWLAMTALSTGLLRLVALLTAAEAHSLVFVTAKVMVELVLSVVSFLLMKGWVFATAPARTSE